MSTDGSRELRLFLDKQFEVELAINELMNNACSMDALLQVVLPHNEHGPHLKATACGSILLQ